MASLDAGVLEEHDEVEDVLQEGLSALGHLLVQSVHLLGLGVHSLYDVLEVGLRES